VCGTGTSQRKLGLDDDVILTTFYIVLYWYPEYLGLNQDETVRELLADPLSYILNGKAASQWFVYGTLYTIAIVGLGYKFILKYLHNKYQLVRTLSVMFFQLGFAFLIPEILEKLNLRKLILLSKKHVAS
jgi:hypothetical protein